MLQLSCLTRGHPSEEKKTLMNNVPNRFIGFVMQGQDAIHKCSIKKLSELRQCGKQIERDRKSRGRLLWSEGWSNKTRRKSYRIPLLCIASTGTYFTASKMELEVILKDVVVKQ